MGWYQRRVHGGHSLVDSLTMKVVLFVAFILLKLVSARDIPAEPNVQEYLKVPLDWIAKYTSSPLEMIQEYSKTSYAEMTKAGNGMVRIAAETAPYVVAITLVVGTFYLILTLVNLVFNTKTNLMKLAAGYVNDNLNIFRDEVPQLMQRMMPEMNLDVLDVIAKMKQKFE